MGPQKILIMGRRLGILNVAVTQIVMIRRTFSNVGYPLYTQNTHQSLLQERYFCIFVTPILTRRGLGFKV